MNHLRLLCALLCAVAPAWALGTDVACPTTPQALSPFCDKLASEDTKLAERINLYTKNLEWNKQMLVRLPCDPGETLKTCKARYQRTNGYYSKKAGRWINYHLFFGDTVTGRHVFTFLLEKDLRDDLDNDRAVLDIRAESDQIKQHRFYGPNGLLARLEKKKKQGLALYLRCCDPLDETGHWNRVMGEGPARRSDSGPGPADVFCPPGFECASSDSSTGDGRNCYCATHCTYANPAFYQNVGSCLGLSHQACTSRADCVWTCGAQGSLFGSVPVCADP